MIEALRAAHIEMWNRNVVDQLGWYVHKIGDAIDTCPETDSPLQRGLEVQTFSCGGEQQVHRVGVVHIRHQVRDQCQLILFSGKERAGAIAAE